MYPDTPDFHPDSDCFGSCDCSQTLLHRFLSLPLSLTSSPFSLGPKPQILPSKSIPRPKGVPNHREGLSSLYVPPWGGFFSKCFGQEKPAQGIQARASLIYSSKRFLVFSIGSIISLRITLLGSRRVSIFVSWFCLNQNFNFGGESSVKSGYSGNSTPGNSGY